MATVAGSEHRVPGPGSHCPPPESHAWWPSCSPQGRSWQSWPFRECCPGVKSQPPQLLSRGKRAQRHERGTQAGGLGVLLRPLHKLEHRNRRRSEYSKDTLVGTLWWCWAGPRCIQIILHLHYFTFSIYKKDTKIMCTIVL